MYEFGNPVSFINVVVISGVTWAFGWLMGVPFGP
ncbi:hypothetical protein LCGC14_0209630 [marine sediment metagenome]|uniref:Uncharacterized protein n=1 Tax=marine sediment metagenome TaxID=412755 RepID=A0A0F9UY83_9ZZZZ